MPKRRPIATRMVRLIVHPETNDHGPPVHTLYTALQKKVTTMKMAAYIRKQREVTETTHLQVWSQKYLKLIVNYTLIASKTLFASIC